MSGLINRDAADNKNRQTVLLKNFLAVIVYFVTVFYTCYLISFIVISFTMTVYEFSDPELFIQAAGASVFLIVGGIDFYRSFGGKWSLVSFILTVPLFAIILFKAIAQNTAISFDVKPLQINGFMKEIFKNL